METTNIPTAPEPSSLISRYAAQIAGQLGCFDRVVLTGNLLDVCHPAALERRLHANHIRCFELGLFAEPLRDAMRDHALTLMGRDLAGQLVAEGARVTVLCPYPSRPLGVVYPNLRPTNAPRVVSENGIEVVPIARFQNCYGPECTWRGRREKAPAAICRRVAMAEEGEAVEIWGNGSPVRSYTYVYDMVDGIYRLMHSRGRGHNWTSAIFHGRGTGRGGGGSGAQTGLDQEHSGSGGSSIVRLQQRADFLHRVA